MLKAIEVENYRSFAHPARLELRPITILMGRNSAGKSSLTRLFPLIRQSMSRETSSPILWTSTTVDFGRIGDVINRASGENNLRISFEIDTQALIDNASRRRRSASSVLRSLNGKRLFFDATLTPTGDGKTDYRAFSIKLGDDSVTITLKDGHFARLYINNERFDTKRYTESVDVFATRLFPTIFFSNGPEKRYESSPRTTQRVDELVRLFVDLPEDNAAIEADNRGKLYLGRSGVSSLIDRCLSEQELYDLFVTQPGFKPDSYIHQGRLQELSRLTFYTFFSNILSFITESITPAFTSSSYLGPIRSSGSRFYREQELSVERIDDKGANLATYIGSLSTRELETFNKLLEDAFGVKIRSHQTVGHISIELAMAGSESYDNLADVGFGFSQLLPLVAQIHTHSRGAYVPLEDQGSQQVIAIEQPELHLHPAFQAQLADLFASAIRPSNTRHRRPYFVLETHSETMLARLGELVVKGNIEPEDLIVHFIEKDDRDGTSMVRVGEFNRDGIISNWPLGFFSARAF